MDLKKLIREVLENKDCCTATKPTKAPILNEGMQSRVLMTENMQYHIDNKKPLYETTLPYGSKEYLDLWVEARYLYSRGALNVEGIDKEKITETDLGEYGMFEGQLVPLDMPMLEEVLLTEDNIAELDKIKKEVEALMPSLSWIDDVNVSSYSGDLYIDLDYKLDPQEIKQLSQLASKYNMDVMRKSSGKNASLVKRRVPPKYEDEELNEAKSKPKKKNPPIGKPKRGGSKKFYVYIRDKGKIKKISFGDTSGLSAKLNNPKARQAFSKRHDCPNKKDRTKASYWSCRLPRYAKLLGLKSNFSGFW